MSYIEYMLYIYYSFVLFQTHPSSLQTGLLKNQAYLIRRRLLKVTVLIFIETVNANVILSKKKNWIF